MRGRRATTKISRSGLTPLTTLRHVIPVEPIHGVTRSTIKHKAAQGPTTAKKRAGDSPRSARRNDVASFAIGPLEDSGGDFKDVIKVLRRKDLIRSSIRHELSRMHCDHPASVPCG